MANIDQRMVVPAALAVLAIVGGAYLLGAPAGRGGADCTAPATRREVAELLFGRNIGDTTAVGEVEFQAFLDAEVTPRFPDGFTVIDTAGQYRARDGGIVREPGKLLLIALDAALTGAAEGRAKIRAVADTYKARFRQESVGIIVRSACVSF